MKKKPTKTAAGRPAKHTPERLRTILDAIRSGNSNAVAAGLAGIDEATLYRWLAAGKAADTGELREFCESYEKALVECEAECVAAIRAAAASPKNWTAAAWLLERRNPETWGMSQRVTVLIGREVDREIASAIAALRKEFADEPDVLERAFAALAALAPAGAAEAESADAHTRLLEGAR